MSMPIPEHGLSASAGAGVTWGFRWTGSMAGGIFCPLTHDLIPDAHGVLCLPSVPIPTTSSMLSVAAEPALCVRKWSGGRVRVLLGCPAASGHC